MDKVLQKEEILFSDIIKERVLEIKMKKYQGDLVINEILNVINTSEKNLQTLENQNLFSRSVKSIFGSNKKLVQNNEKNVVLMQKMSLELLHALIESNVINTNLVKDIVKELGDIRSDNYEIASALKKTMTKFGDLKSRVGIAEHKLNLHDMITKIEYGAYDREDKLYSILDVLSDLDPGSITIDSQIDLLRRCVNRYIIIEDQLEPLQTYLVKISRIENLKAEKIRHSLEISEDNPVAHAIADTLAYASTHNELQKKFQFSVTALKEIMTYIDVSEQLTVSDLMNLIIQQMLIRYENGTLDNHEENQVIEEKLVDIPIDNRIYDLFKDILIKNYQEITTQYHFYKYTKDDIRSDDFSYEHFLKEIDKAPFTDFIEANINQIVFNLACIFGEIEVINQIDNRELLVNQVNNLSQMTPLMYASSYGQTEVVKYLIGYKANINCKNHYQKTALILALENNYLTVANLLINKGSSLVHRKLLTIVYEKSLNDLIFKIEKYYFRTFRNGDNDIIDILLKHIPKIALNYPFEIVKNINHTSSKITNALNAISGDNTTLQDVVALIDTSRFKNGKEGILFTYRGFYVKYKNIHLYQPYFLINDVNFENQQLLITNSLSTTYYKYSIANKYGLNFDKLNQTELFIMLSSIKELVNNHLKLDE